MKGITKQLRDLAVGEQIIVTGTERSDIHRIASRVGIKIKCERFIDGFYVTRMDKTIAPLAPPVEQVVDDLVIDTDFEF